MLLLTEDAEVAEGRPVHSASQLAILRAFALVETRRKISPPVANLNSLKNMLLAQECPHLEEKI
jgi:hypothetical protein